MWRTFFKPIMWVFDYELVLLCHFDKITQVRYAKVLKNGDIYVQGIHSYFLLPSDGSGSGYIREWYRI